MGFAFTFTRPLANSLTHSRSYTNRPSPTNRNTMRVLQPTQYTTTTADMAPSKPDSQVIASYADSAKWVYSPTAPKAPTLHHAIPARTLGDAKDERSPSAASAPIAISSGFGNMGRPPPPPLPPLPPRGPIPPRPSPGPPLPPTPLSNAPKQQPSHVPPSHFEFLPGMPGLPGWEPGPARVHHHADTLTDYCKKKTSGWQPLQEKRVRRCAWEVDRWMRWAPGPREEFGQGWVEEERRAFERLGRGDIVEEEEREREERGAERKSGMGDGAQRSEGGVGVVSRKGEETPRSDSMFTQ
jgi:hypothetical protein